MRKDFYPKFGQPVLAWLASCLVAACIAVPAYVLSADLTDPESPDLIGLAAIPGLFALILLGAAVIALATVLPALVLVRVARSAQLPRGWADALLPAAISFAVIVITHVGEDGLGGGLMGGWLQNAPTFAVAGAAAGLTYWLLAGRPRPPY